MARTRTKKLVGEALAPFRERVVIATKFGFKIDANANKPGWIAGLRTSRSRGGFAEATQERHYRFVLSAPG